MSYDSENRCNVRRFLKVISGCSLNVESNCNDCHKIILVTHRVVQSDIQTHTHTHTHTVNLISRSYSGLIQSTANHHREAGASLCRLIQTLVQPQPGQTCFQRLCSMFLLASPTSTSSMVTGRRVREDTCPRLCHSPGGLLQHGSRWCTNVCH